MITTPTHSPRPWATLLAVAIGTAASLYASPQVAPHGDSEVADFIRVDVNADTQLQGTVIQVRVESGVAIITGSVRSLEQAERASARAIAAGGVRAVINQVSITPESAADILKGARSALEKQRMVRADDIRVSISGGRVSLAGKVGTWDEKDLARQLVSTVPGVVAIKNDLVVTFEGVRDDSQVEEQIRFMIRQDPLYDTLQLSVSVDGGTVRLGGEVGSRAEYDRLIRRSYVTGITDVQISGLSIDHQLAMEGLSDKDFNKKEAVLALQDAYQRDSRLQSSTIRVEMNDGVIRLSGHVDQAAQSDAAESTARVTPGVLRVANELKITGGAPMAAKPGELKLASPPTVKRRK